MCVCVCITKQARQTGRSHSHPEETMLTMMEVEVEELWTRTVTRMPTTSPATGLDSTALSWKMSPATLPTHTHTHAFTDIYIYKCTQRSVHTFSHMHAFTVNIKLYPVRPKQADSCLQPGLSEDILPPTNWKAELRMSSEHTKRKRRRKAAGILDQVRKVFLMPPGVSMEPREELAVPPTTTDQRVHTHNNTLLLVSEGKTNLF